jgi:hypothetical protein
MKKKMFVHMLITLGISAALFGCAYMGFHGKSIRAYPDIHANVRTDQECLECHHPDKDPQGPPTPHPRFTGCIKCHNDEIAAKS